MIRYLTDAHRMPHDNIRLKGKQAVVLCALTVNVFHDHDDDDDDHHHHHHHHQHV